MLVDMAEKLNLKFKKAGKGFLGECPFCGGGRNTPCFSFNEEVYHCFSCGEKGNVYTFAKAFSLSLPVSFQKQKQRRERKEEEVRELNTEFLYLYHKVPDKESLVWLKNRGIDYSSVKEWLYFAIPKFNKYYYAGYRIAVPSIDKFGTVRGAKIRNVLGKEPKALAMTGSQLYSVGIHALYNGMELLTDFVLIVEGEMDWLSVKSISPEYPVVALPSAGYRFKESEIKSLPKNIILLLDNDEAGQKNALRLKAELEKEGKRVSLKRYPDGYKDFNEILMADKREAIKILS